MIDNKYELEQFKLIKSLIIKAHFLAVQQNINIRERLGINIDFSITPLEEWPYYKNIAGEYTEYNTKIYYDRFDTNENVLLTKEYLQNNPVIRNELLKYDEYYLNLLSLYPNDGILINGILNPIDKSVAINAPDGTILYYNNSYIKENETIVMKELEDYIKSFITRWLNPKYVVTDKRYFLMLYGVLFTNLYNVLRTIKIKYIDTINVSDEFMSYRFKSELGIDSYIDELPYNIKLWLYKNLDYLIYNIGKVSNLKIINEHILQPLGIDLLKITKHIPNTIPQLDSFDKPTFKYNDKVFYLETIDESPISLINISNIISLDKIDNNNMLSMNETNIIYNKLHLNKGIKEESKEFILTTYVDFQNKYITNMHYIISTILLFLYNEKDNVFVIEYKNSSNKLTGLDIIYSLIDSLLKLNNISVDTITKLKLDYIDFSNLDISDLKSDSDIFTYSKFDEFINYCKTILPSDFNLNNYSNIEDLFIRLNNVESIYYDFINNEAIGSLRPIINSRIKNSLLINIDYNNKDIQYLEEDPLSNINVILSKLLNIDSFINDKTKQLLLNMKNFLQEMVSYTVKFIIDNIDNSLYLDADLPTSTYGLNMIKINKSLYYCLGEKGSISTGIINDKKIYYRFTPSLDSTVRPIRDNRPIISLIASKKNYIIQNNINANINRI